MTPFELLEPSTLGEALEHLAAGPADVRAASGCTALMLMMKASVLAPSRLVSLRRLAPRMSAIEKTGGAIRIGALATLRSIERSPLVRSELPVLAWTLERLANVRVRNQATIGGHLAHADPHMDLPPLLTALGASVVIAGRSGERSLAVEELITGYLETALAAAEVIAAVRIPVDPQRRSVYRKVTARSADDWPSLGVAVALGVANARIGEARIVAGAAFDRPIRLAAAEAILNGAAPSERLCAEAAGQAASEAQPIADQHGSAAYKMQLVRVSVARALAECLGYPAPGVSR